MRSKQQEREVFSIFLSHFHQFFHQLITTRSENQTKLNKEQEKKHEQYFKNCEEQEQNGNKIYKS